MGNGSNLYSIISEEVSEEKEKEKKKKCKFIV